jgi:hypothetical protein
MEKIKQSVPFVLILTYISLLTIRQPNIADAIVAIGLCALAGFKLYLDSNKAPDMKAEVQAELQKRDEELHALKSQLGTLSFNLKKEKSINEQFKF